MSKQTHSFQAEVAQLLHLVTHSLYSNKEIFLRELVSNASDACDKLRFEALHDSTLYEDAPELEVRIDCDREARTLTITDNGIGMSAQEAIDHLGTIAKSGTREFMARLGDEKRKDAQAQGALIGQFGVGFYSAFIVADKVVVESRRAGLPPEDGVRWTSGGLGDFEVEAITRAQRGTSITLHLREDAHIDYTNRWHLRTTVAKYSDHISLPVRMRDEEWNSELQKSVLKDEWETVNQASALWTRPKKDITPEQYHDFYKQLSRDDEAPLAYSHNRVEGAQEYTQLLYIPARSGFDAWSRDRKANVKLYVKRVFIMDEADTVMPAYLRFVTGVVDSADLPLNVSRELLQDSRDARAILEGNTRRVLALLEDLAKNEPEKYATFWSQFGALLKEGLGEDFRNRDRIAQLLRFASSTSDGPTVSLADYKARMREGQDAIYYLTADSVGAARNSPQLELFRKKGIEVLLMGDRVDEWAISHLHEFEGKPLKSVSRGEIDLGSLQDEAEKKQAEQAASSFKATLDRLKETLKDKARDVRVTTRLVDSPACLVVGEGEMTPQFVRLLRQGGQPTPDIKPILEINAEHTLVRKLDGHAHFDDLAHILFDQALLADGGLPDDPAGYVRRVNALLA